MRLIWKKDPEEEDIRRARNQVVDAAGEFLLRQLMATRIGERYFGGESPLFPHMEEQLAEIVGQAELAVSLYNDRVELMTEMKPQRRRKKRKVSAETVDVDTLRVEVEPSVQGLVGQIVDMAKAETAMFMGHRRQAGAIMRRLVWTEQ